MKKFFQRSIRKQILAVFFSAAFIPVIVIGLITIREAYRQAQDRYGSQIIADCSRVKSMLFDTTLSLYNSCEPIVSSQAYRDLLGAREGRAPDSYYQLEFTLSTLYQTQAAISSIMVYTDNPAVRSGAWITRIDEFGEEYWYAQAKPDSWYCWRVTTRMVNRNQSQEEMTLIRRINIGSETYRAYLVATVSDNYLRNRLATSDYLIYASIGSGPCFFTSRFSDRNEKMIFSDRFNGRHFNYLGWQEWGGEKRLVRVSSLTPYKTNEKFYVMVSDRKAGKELADMTVQYVIILFAAILVPLGIILAFSRSTGKRVSRLKKAMNQASRGDFRIMESVPGYDELADIYQDLKIMVSGIEEREKAWYLGKLREEKLIGDKKEMQFKMLASQINPHFLYNTLETIRMQAVRSEEPGIADSILLLSRTLRYVLGNTETTLVPLARELEYTETWMEIEKLRFGERISYDLYIDQDIDSEKLLVIPMLLQPVAENAIIHGI
ncbi:MAG: histidine kinase [Parasporobacterium sp.]|nr:histidine kinase [Parasporobacterium sp.]